jgi:S1-C subfamily serine protease
MPSRGFACNRTRIFCLAVLALLLALGSGCQAGRRGAGYGVFDTPAGRVNSLLDDNLIQNASRVYNDNPGYFTKTDAATTAACSRLARALMLEIGPQAEAALEALDREPWPSGPAAWPEIHKSLALAQSVLQSAAPHRVLSAPEFRPAVLERLSARNRDLRLEITADAPEMLAGYPLLDAKESFFKTYPIEIDAAKAFGDSEHFWEKRLQGATPAEILRVFELYGASLPIAVQESMGETYYLSIAQSERERGATALAAALSAAKAVRRAGMPLAAAPGAKVVFVNITSRTLLRKGLLDFPVSIDNDTPFETSRGSMRRLFAGNATLDADFYVLVDTASTRCERTIYKKKKRISEYLSEVQTVENRYYIEARDRLLRLRQKYDSAGERALFATDPFVQLFGAFSQSRLDDDLEKAEERLKDTPMFVEKEVYSEYTYPIFDMETVKLATVNYYVVDMRARRYFKDVFDVRESQSFSVAYGVNLKDPHRQDILANKDDEEDVTDFEDAPVRIPLSAILEQFASQPAKGRPLVSLASLADQIFADRNRAVELAKKTRMFTGDEGSDERFKAVVYVSLPQSRGSGFYVRDDVVMTNYHVVEDSDFVEIRLYDGAETFGKVIAKDIQHDLALIKVQARRKPLRFYSGNSLPLGATAEVIGNPQGYKFSISRGVISAVRRHRPLMAMQSKPNLYIQTDAAINPGNSGGPLFLGDAVIGVVDFTRVQSEGLNFAIHYSDALAFMKKSGIEPVLAKEENQHVKK